jgi:DNA-binding CsgD family transcriptional regulator
LDACANAHMMSGGGLMRSMYERAMVLERDRPAFASESSYGSLAVMLKTIDHLDEAREMLLTILRSDADDGAVPFVLSHLPQLELWAGNWDLAEEYAHQHLDAALRTGQHDQTAQAMYNLAFLDVHRGDAANPERVGVEMMGAGVASGSLWTERNGAALVGLSAISRGDAAAAVTSLGRWADISAQIGLREPGYCRLLADLVEALVATGDLHRAETVVATMTEAATRLDRATALATARRVGALVAAAQGDHVRAVDLATAAVAVHSTSPLVFEHARALLTLGQVHRRFREKSAARRALESALDEFVRLGADGLAERTRLDLARIGLRPPARSDLTETERRVARAAATGRTVRQVGDELFISPKTVEANLTRVYRKLGIGGRAELAAWVAAGEPIPRD